MNTDIAWTREGCHLTHIEDNVTDLVGWTAEEIMAMAVESLVSPASWSFLKENYYVGPASKIATRSFPIHLRHRDGHELCCYAIVVCRYDVVACRGRVGTGGSQPHGRAGRSLSASPRPPTRPPPLAVGRLGLPVDIKKAAPCASGAAFVCSKGYCDINSFAFASVISSTSTSSVGSRAAVVTR